MRTFSPKPQDITKAWLVVDADGLVLGRLATEVAARLRGKHKPIFAPHVDTGDHVIVVNAAKIVLTAGKSEKKVAYRHSGYPGGLKEELLRRHARDAARGGRAPCRAGHAARAPGSGRQQLLKLKVYAGPDHPHEAQQPVAPRAPRPPGPGSERRHPAAPKGLHRPVSTKTKLPAPLTKTIGRRKARRRPRADPAGPGRDHREPPPHRGSTSPRPPTACW